MTTTQTTHLGISPESDAVKCGSADYTEPLTFGIEHVTCPACIAAVTPRPRRRRRATK